jgi:HEAT repeat protein
VTARRRLVAAAGHTGDVATARAGLQDPDGAVRAAALGALARAGVIDESDVRAGLADSEPRVRARAAELASGLGTSLAAETAQLLTDRSDPVVDAACFSLGEMGAALEDSTEAVSALAAVARHHRNPLCREAAVAALGAIGAAGGLDPILDSLGDKPAVRRRAVVALASYDGPAVDAALERALTDRDWQVRQAAEDLTGRSGA